MIILSLFCGVCFYVTSRYVLGCWHRRCNFQCKEYLLAYLSVHSFFDVRIWYRFMAGRAPFLYLWLLANHRCQMEVILLEIHPGIFLHSFFFYIHFTLYLAFQNSAKRTVFSFAWSIQLFCDINNSYLIIFKSQIVIKNEINFLIQNFVFLIYTNSKTL